MPRRAVRTFFLALALLACGPSPAWPQASHAAGRTLSLDGAVRHALAHNPEIVAERLDVQVAEAEHRRSRDRYGLSLTFKPDGSRSMRPATSQFLSGNPQVEESRLGADLSLKQSLPTGGAVSLAWKNGLTDTNSTRVDVNPAYNPKVSLNVNQPLLRDGGEGFSEFELADRSLARARLQLRDRLLRLAADTSGAYWDLVSEREELEVLEGSRRAAQSLVEANKAKLAVGMAARIDVVQAEASLAARDAAVLDARRKVANAADRLRQFIGPGEAATTSEDGADLLPGDRPRFSPRPLDFERSLALSRERRPDYLIALLDAESRRLEADAAARDTLPALNLTADTGVESLEGAYIPAVRDLATFRNFFVSVGLGLELPLTRSAQRDAHDRALLLGRQSQLRVAALETRIPLEVRQAIRNVEVGARSLEATTAAQKLAQEKLDAEREKLNLGLSTNFQVIAYQNDLDEASLKLIAAHVSLLRADVELRRLEGTLLDGYQVAEEP